MKDKARRPSYQFRPKPDPTYAAVFDTMRNWTQVCREYERRHPGERMNKQHAKQIHDIAIWKMRVALGIAPNVPTWHYRNSNGTGMTADHEARAAEVLA